MDSTRDKAEELPMHPPSDDIPRQIIIWRKKFQINSTEIRRRFDGNSTGKFDRYSTKPPRPIHHH